MKWLSTVKGWPEKKKKTFSIISAGALTILIVAAWIAFRPSTNTFVESDANNKAIQYVTKSFNEISNQFNTLGEQLFGTSSASTTEATSATTTQ
jgi:hypothetical protein